MVLYPYVASLTLDANSGNVVGGATGEVFAKADATFTTPLPTVDASGNPVTLTSNTNGVLPSFYIDGYTAVNWKSGAWVLPLVTSEPVEGPEGPAGVSVNGATTTGDDLVFSLSNGATTAPVKLPVAAGGSDAGVASYISTPGTETNTALNATIAEIVGPKIPTEKVIVLGTSIAAAYGATNRDPARAYPAKISQYLTSTLGETYTAIAAGVSGNTTGQMLDRLPALLDTHKPAYVTIEVSVNDSRVDLNVAQETTINNLRKMISKVRLARAVPVLLTSMWFDPVVFNSASYNASSVTKAASTNALAKTAADALGVQVVDIYTYIGEDRTVLSDGLHPNDSGHDKWGRAVVQDITGIGQGITPWVAPLAGDNFDRADGGPGTTQYGSFAWTPAGGTTWGIRSGQLQCLSETTFANNNDLTIEDGQANGTISVTLATYASARTIGVPFRLSGTDNNNGYLFWRNSSGGYTLSRRTGPNAYTTIQASTAVTPAVGDVLSVVLNGSSITCKVNGTTIISATDGTYTGTRHGVWDPSPGTGSAFDNWKHEAA